MLITAAVLAGPQPVHADTEPPTKKVQVQNQAAAPPAIPASPSDADLRAYIAYHHARYLVKSAEQAGGTNKLLHTRTLPTEGNDPVVTPALDHL